jgi:hypothetical protein
VIGLKLKEVFDFVTPYPDFDIAAILHKSKNENDYASRNLRFWNYERHLDRF